MPARVIPRQRSYHTPSIVSALRTVHSKSDCNPIPFFICFNAYKSSLLTTTPSHLSFCAAEIVGVVVFPIKVVIFFLHPFLVYLLFIQIRREKKKKKKKEREKKKSL